MRTERLRVALGVATLALGAVVVIGWHARVVRLVQPLQGETPMVYNTALCFILNGAGLLTLGRGRKWSWLPATALLLASLTLVEYALGADLGMDRLLFTPWFTTGTPFPGRMAPNTALAHLLAAAAIVVLGWFQGKRAGIAAAMVGSFVAGMALVCVTGYATGIEAAYRWGSLTSMAPHTGAGLVLLGLGVAEAASSRTEHRSLPALSSALAVATMATALAQAIAAHPARAVHSEALAAVTLAVGFTIAALIGMSVHFEQATRDRAEALQRANVDLQAMAAALHESQAQFSDVFRSAPDAIVVVGPHGRILELSPSAEKAFGYARDELVGQLIEVLVPERFRPVHPARRTAYAADPRPRPMGQGLELYALRKDGSEFPVDITLGPMATSSGPAVIAIIRDVTARKQLDEALARQTEELTRQRQFLRQVIDQNPSLIFVKDREGRFTLVNRALAEAYGTSVEVLLGKTDADFNPNAEEVRAFRRDDLEVMDSGREKVLGEEVLTDARGVRRWLYTVKRPLLSPDGKANQVLGVANDISDRKRAEERLAESQRFLEKVVGAVPGIVYIYDLEERRNVYSSTQIGSVLGYTPEQVEALGASLMERLVHPEDLPRVLESHATDHEMKDGEIRERTYRMKDASGNWRWLLSRDAPFERRQGRVSQILGIAMDVTEQRQTEQMLQRSQKLEAVGSLAGGIAHDFNNVLGVITGYGELARGQLPPQHPVQARLEHVLQAAARAAGLTRQLLAFSRKQVMQPRILDLNAVVSDLDKMLRRVLGEDVDLVVEAAPALGAVKADPTQLEQILMNLVVNARDAMPKGGHLRIETANADFDEEYAANHPPAQPGRFVMLAVSDTGIGMDAETQQRIFEPFFTTKPAGEGTGLGLATVYGIVKQSGGYIWVYSEPGRGTTFRVYLPRVDEKAEASVAAATPMPPPRGDETLLLVEDTEGLREMICEVLEGQGYTVLVASDGEQALALAREHRGRIHLVLTDVVMPKLGGADLAKELALARPGIRVLYMSGYTNGVISRHGVAGQGVSLLEKPFTTERLAQAVREALDRPQPS